MFCIRGFLEATKSLRFCVSKRGGVNLDVGALWLDCITCWHILAFIEDSFGFLINRDTWWNLKMRFAKLCI